MIDYKTRVLNCKLSNSWRHKILPWHSMGVRQVYFSFENLNFQYNWIWAIRSPVNLESPVVRHFLYMDLSGQPHTQEQNLRIEQLSAVIEENYLHFRRSKRMKFPVKAW